MFFLFLRKNWLGAHRRLRMIYPPPLTNKAWFSSDSVWKRLNDPRDGTARLSVWSLAILQACLINPSLGEIRETQHGAIIFIYGFYGKFSKQESCFFEAFFTDPHRRCRDSWTFIFQPSRQCLSDWLLKCLRSFLGAGGEDGRKPRRDRRLKGSRTRKICPEAGRVQLGSKRALARTEPRRLPARASSEQGAACPRFLPFCSLSGSVI